MDILEGFKKAVRNFRSLKISSWSNAPIKKQYIYLGQLLHFFYFWNLIWNLNLKGNPLCKALCLLHVRSLTASWAHPIEYLSTHSKPTKGKPWTISPLSFDFYHWKRLSKPLIDEILKGVLPPFSTKLYYMHTVQVCQFELKEAHKEFFF